MAIVDEQTFAIRDTQDVVRSTASNELSAVVRWILGDGVWQTARRIIVAVENIGEGVTSFCTRYPSPDDRGNVRVLDPWLQNSRANGVRNDNGVLVVRSDGEDEIVCILPQGPVFATDATSVIG